MLGRKLRQPLSQLLSTYQDEGTEEIVELTQRVAQRQQQMKQYTDHRRKSQTSEFQPESWVRVKRPLRGLS